MIKIEDIFESHTENWKVYNTLLEKKFLCQSWGQDCQ